MEGEVRAPRSGYLDEYRVAANGLTRSRDGDLDSGRTGAAPSLTSPGPGSGCRKGCRLSLNRTGDVGVVLIPVRLSR